MMYSMTQRIKYSELDSAGKLSMPALLNLFQDVATMQTEDVGFPLKELMKSRQGWFVVSYRIKNYNLPEHGDEIVIKTFPIKVKGFMGFRLFKLEDLSGKLLSEAYSEWVHMDLNTMRPSRVPPEMTEAYGPDEIDISEYTGSRKIAIPDCERTLCDKFIVGGAYLDTNKHMNNAYYIEPALLAAGDEDFGYIRMEFKTSAMDKDEIYIYRYDDGGRVVISLESPEGEKFCVVEFKKEYQ